jgi:hypothetical protein
VGPEEWVLLVVEWVAGADDWLGVEVTGDAGAYVWV